MWQGQNPCLKVYVCINFIFHSPSWACNTKILTHISFLGFLYLCSLMTNSFESHPSILALFVTSLNLKVNLEIVNSTSKKYQRQEEGGMKSFCTSFTCDFTHILSPVLHSICIIVKHGFAGICFEKGKMGIPVQYIHYLPVWFTMELKYTIKWKRSLQKRQKERVQRQGTPCSQNL